jgi:thiol-disulfide isomerase/thioredoxin
MKIINFKIIFILLFTCLLCSSCSQKKIKDKNKFILYGKILNKKKGFLVLEYIPDSITVKDTIFIKNGVFTVEGFISEPTLATIVNGNDEWTFYLEQKNMNVTIIKDKFKLEGSKTQKESEQLEKIRNINYSKVRVLFEKKDSLMKLSSKIEKNELGEKLKDIDNKILKEKNVLESEIIQFILNNPKSFIVPYQLTLLQENYSIPLDSVKSIFNKLEKSVQNSRHGKILRKNILKEEKIQIGKIPPNFQVTDINNKQISLKQFKGENIVLLEFWASWCAPCRKSFPHLKELYEKYHTNGFEIIAVTVFDSNIESWKKAINKDKISNWHNVASNFMSGEVINQAFLNDYNPTPIPKKILIDKDGKVVGIWVGYSKEIESDIDKKLKEIFSNF